MSTAGGVEVDRRLSPVEVAPGDVAPTGRPPRRRRRGVRWPFWDDTCAALAAHPAFRRCTPKQIRSIARLGDMVEIGEGAVVIHEDRIGYWFLAIFEGSIGLGRDGAPLATLGPGTQTGEIAIIGFGPNPATVTALSAVRAFVIGRRHLLALMQHPELQRGLFGLTGSSYLEHVRVLRAEGEAAWRRLPQGKPPAPMTRESLPASFRLVAPKYHGASALVAGALTAPRAAASRVSTATRMAPRTVGLIVATLVAAAGVLTFTIRPPLVVVTPAPAVDVARDITIRGAPAHPIEGRYLLVAVHVERPTVAGWALALARGDHIEPLSEDGVDDEEEHRIARQAFVASRTAAVRRAVLDAGLDPNTVTVDVRDRGLIGPSAGLVYALAVRDLLDADDLVAGRTVAATGVVDDAGRVGPVGWMSMKAGAARTAHADVFIVPVGQGTEARTAGVRVVPVTTLTDARLALRRPAD